MDHAEAPISLLGPVRMKEGLMNNSAAHLQSSNREIDNSVHKRHFSKTANTMGCQDGKGLRFKLP